MVSRDSIYCMLQKCRDARDARRVHCLMLSSKVDWCSIATPLADFLIRSFTSFGFGCLLDACLVFCSIPHPNVYTWHAIISAHVALDESERALALYTRMQAGRTEPDKVLILCILKACSNIGAFEEGCFVYRQAIIHKFEMHPSIQSAVIYMYANCGSIDDARNVFDTFGKRDTVLWSTMIAAYVQHDHAVDAIQLYRNLHFEGIEPDKVTFLCILRAISHSDLMYMGMMIHHEILMRQDEVDAVLGSTIVHMYVKCGCMEDAQAAFNKLQSRNAVTWNAMIAGHAWHGHGYSALDLYSRMQQQDGFQPEKITFLCTLKACGNIGIVEHGRLVHDQLIRNEFDWDPELKNALIDMYAKCRSLSEADKVFKTVNMREVVAWNSLIGGYSQQGQSENVLGLFRDMQKEGLMPDKVTFSFTLKACASMETLNHGRLLHDKIMKIGLDFDVVVGSAIVDMYCKCKSLKDGRKVFEGIRGRNLVSWNAIISGHMQCDKDQPALELFEQMQLEGVEPNYVTLSCILKSCSNLGDIENSKMVHDRIIRSGSGIDAVLVCTLVDVYAKCGGLKESRWAFDRLPDRNVAAWAALITGYSNHGHSLHALEVFQEMQEDGLKPDKVTYLCVLKAASLLNAVEDGNWIHDQILRDNFDSDIVIGNTLVDMYAKCNKLDEACRVFDELPSRDVVSWGAIITGCVQCGDGVVALGLYEEMEAEGKEPERSTYLCILRACGSVGALEEGNIVHEKVVRQCLDSDAAIGNTLVDMYAKCGRMRDAENVFQGLFCRDVVSWNAMISGHALQGNYGAVRWYLQDMQRHGLNPDDRTYTSILASCGHAGAVEECLDFFKNMNDVKPGMEHFNCMIDVFARSGCLADAKEILQSMPVLPDSTGWVSLLSSCKVHGDLKIGGQCFNQVIETDPDLAPGDMLTMPSILYGDSLTLSPCS